MTSLHLYQKDILSGFAAGRIQRLSPTIISYLLQVGDLISCCLLHWSGVSRLRGPRTACGVFPPFYCVLHCSRVCLEIIGIVGRHRKNSVFPPKFAILTLYPELLQTTFKDLIRHILHLTVFSCHVVPLFIQVFLNSSPTGVSLKAYFFDARLAQKRL